MVSGQTPSQPLLHLVDDRGKAILSPLDLCFQVELRTDCRSVVPGKEVRIGTSFYSLRIEGPEHGPVRLRREELKAQDDGSYRIAVPRKARLRIDSGLRRDPLTVSLYAPASPTFREPIFRARLEPGETEAKIPAGTFIASLTLAQNAPDLHRLTAGPAEHVRLGLQPRPGWSLVLRCQGAGSAKPVHGAEARAAEAFGFGRKDRPLAVSTSGPDGLVLLNGLQASMANVSVRHPDFIPGEVQGLTASPGTFAFRNVDLASGGRLAARITVHGRPLARVRCQVYALAPEAPDPKQPYRQLWEGRADRSGVCRADRMPQGVYKLRLSIPESTARVDRWVHVTEGQEREEDVALAPTRVLGEVRRGGRAAAEYSVVAFPIGSGVPKGAKSDDCAEGRSDEDGKYELTLWEPGRYGFLLRSPSGSTVVGTKELSTDGDDERKLDFDLDASSLHGVVLDATNRPVPEAKVTLLWWAGGFATTTDRAGQFEIDAQGEGKMTLTAYKTGYLDSDPVETEIAKDTAPPPVTLVLKKKNSATGMVLSAGGPVAGAYVASVGANSEGGPALYDTARSGMDGSFEVETPGGSPRVYLSGPGCPLAGFTLADPSASGASAPPQTLRCPDTPASLEVMLDDAQGKPVAHAGVILMRDGVVIPQSVLAGHLRLLGLSAETDGTGHLGLAGLAPGSYDLFLNLFASESTIAAGSREGYLTTVDLPALETTELQLTLPEGR